MKCRNKIEELETVLKKPINRLEDGLLVSITEKTPFFHEKLGLLEEVFERDQFSQCALIGIVGYWLKEETYFAEKYEGYSAEEFEKYKTRLILRLADQLSRFENVVNLSTYY